MFINIVILGATGDLASKKILPACGELTLKNPQYSINIIPWSRKPIENIDQLNQYITPNKSVIKTTIIGNYSDPDIIDSILKSDPDSLFIFYLAIPPSANFDFVNAISKTSMRNYEIILEKPYSVTKQDFLKLDELIFNNKLEKKINFLDHYLFKDSYQFNPTVLRFLENSIKSPISKLSVKVLESIDIGNRKDFYDSTGCINDMFFHVYNIYFKLIKTLDEQEDLNITNLIKGQYESYQTDIGKPSRTDTAFQLILQNKNQLITFESAKKLNEKLTSLEVEFSDSSILTWNIYPESRLEYYSKNSFLNLGLKNLNSDHYNIFEALIRGDKSNFVQIPTIRTAWLLLDKVHEIKSEINIY